MTTKRSAAAATIFSRVCAPPPPFTSQPSGATWSAPSIARSRRSSPSNARREPELARRAPRWPATWPRTAARARARRGPGGGSAHGRAGPQADRHPVLDDQRRRLGGRVLSARRRSPSRNVPASVGAPRPARDRTRGGGRAILLYAADFARLGAQIEDLCGAGARIFTSTSGTGTSSSR